MDILYGWLVVGGGIFWTRDVGGHFLWVGGDGWMWVKVYFKCEEMGKHFLRVGADRWGCILVGWRGGGICYGWVGVIVIGGGIFWVCLGGWRYILGDWG